ncbi:MAG TPA: SDR family oxidoreductase [Ktedonobacterales bacterium]|nr:SDR family oxidoreductase [Ktedonobacterales bacterium]
MATATHTMQGKVCLITGANSGIGKATALGLASLGATVVLVCRDKHRGEAAQAEIKAQSGNESVDLLLVDLASQASIRQLATEVKARYPHLHVLLNNAGVMPSHRTLTADGLEVNFAINHLGPFLLTNLLLDTLKASAPSRIVFVASQVVSALDFDDLQSEQRFGMNSTYGKSKLCNILVTQELAKRLEGTGVTVNCLHPGLVSTNLSHDWSTPLRVVYRFVGMRPAKGAQTAIYLASSPEVEGITGKYFKKQRPAPVPRLAQDEATTQRLWQVSEEMTQPGSH